MGVLVALLLVGFVANVYHVRQQYHIDGKVACASPRPTLGHLPPRKLVQRVEFRHMLPSVPTHSCLRHAAATRPPRCE